MQLKQSCNRRIFQLLMCFTVLDEFTSPCTWIVILWEETCAMGEYGSCIHISISKSLNNTRKKNLLDFFASWNLQGSENVLNTVYSINKVAKLTTLCPTIQHLSVRQLCINFVFYKYRSYWGTKFCTNIIIVRLVWYDWYICLRGKKEILEAKFNYLFFSHSLFCLNSDIEN